MAKKVLKVIVNPTVDNSAAIALLQEQYKVVVFEGIKKSSDIINANMILFVNGPHVNPQHYTEKLGKYTTIDKERDETDQQIYNIARRYGKFMVGFGRGAEFLNVMSGGKMIQHVNNHSEPHYIASRSYKSAFMTPSSHTQMMYPYELPSDKYEILAWSKKFQSTTYLDGNNDEMDLVDEFLEPEVIFFKSTKAIAFQGDPTEKGCDEDFKNFVFLQINSNVN